MTIPEVLVLLGAIINILGSFSYAKSTIEGKTKPNKITWLLWSIAPFIGAVAAFSSGVTWAAIPVFAAGFAPFVIFVSSFLNKRAYWKLGKFDYICGTLSLLALILWALTRQPIVAIILAIASDALAALPTAAKAWKFPETESPYAYLAGGFNAITSFFVIKTWTFTEYAFPSYLVILCFGILFLILRKNLFRK